MKLEAGKEEVGPGGNVDGAPVGAGTDGYPAVADAVDADGGKPVDGGA